MPLKHNCVMLTEFSTHKITSFSKFQPRVYSQSKIPQISDSILILQNTLLLKIEYNNNL